MKIINQNYFTERNMSGAKLFENENLTDEEDLQVQDLQGTSLADPTCTEYNLNIQMLDNLMIPTALQDSPFASDTLKNSYARDNIMFNSES